MNDQKRNSQICLGVLIGILGLVGCEVRQSSDMDSESARIDPSDIDGDGVPNDSDCAPNESTLQVNMYRDEDNDDEAAPGSLECVGLASNGLSPSGYSYEAGNDCNDTNPEIYTNAPDLWGDELDHNCDGLDGLGEDPCTWEQADCTTVVDAAMEPFCAGVDLAVIDSFGLIGCVQDEDSYAVIANLGDTLFEGIVDLEGYRPSGDPGNGTPAHLFRTQRQLRLEPAAYTHIDLEVLPDWIYVYPVDGNDCDVTNNRVESNVVYVDCE